MGLGNRGRVIRNVLLAWVALGTFALFGLFDGLGSWVSFLLCFCYGSLFEYLYHRDWLHESRGIVWRRHAIHHVKYMDDGFRTADPMADNISEDWFFLPIALLAHAPFVSLIGGVGLTTYYCLFELIHWSIHREDTALEAVLSRVPGIRVLWIRTLEHHRTHHERSDSNFNFVYPFPWDRLFKTRRAA